MRQKKAKKQWSKKPRKPQPFFVFIKNQLRHSTYKWHGRNEAINEARQPDGMWRCKACGNKLHRSQIKADHIEPVVPTTGQPRIKEGPYAGREDLNSYIYRMFVEKEGWQILCDECHDKKTDTERLARVISRREAKAEFVDLDEFGKAA